MIAIRSAAVALALLISTGSAIAQDQGILGLWTTDKAPETRRIRRGNKRTGG